MTREERCCLRIFRGEPGVQYWEEFDLPYDSESNVISLLMAIRHNPKNALGKDVTPVAWESGCLEEVCGSCSMLINGVPRQACSALVRNIVKETGSTTLRLAPFTKFPLVRDLVVDRTRMFENLKRIRGWVDVGSDGYHGSFPGPNISPETQELMYALSTCMTCGCCSESCPQVNSRSEFMGPAPIAQTHYFSLHPTAAHESKERLEVMETERGVLSCGNAQNCVRVCPKKIPLTNAIGAVNRALTLKALKGLFGSIDDRE